jgi:hypothetical protein
VPDDALDEIVDAVENAIVASLDRPCGNDDVSFVILERTAIDYASARNQFGPRLLGCRTRLCGNGFSKRAVLDEVFG